MYYKKMEKKNYQQPRATMINIANYLLTGSNPGNENPGGGSGASLDVQFEEGE